MKIVMIGAGNLATQLGKALLKAGHDILQVYSRTMASANALAQCVGGVPVTDVNLLAYDADVYIFALRDSVLGEMIPKVCHDREQRVFLHTAGSVPMSAFQGMALHYGVLYPLQTLTKSRDIDFHTVPCFVEGNDDYARKVIGGLAGSVSRNVRPLSSEQRKYVHLAAVWACNFVNHCYDVAADVLESQHIPFEVLLPLIDETARKVHEMPPSGAQTGPAVRYDENIIREQAQLMRKNPLTKELYERLSVSVYQKNKYGND